MRKLTVLLIVLAALALIVLLLLFGALSAAAQGDATPTPGLVPVGCWYPNGTWVYWTECPVRVVTATPGAPTVTPSNTPQPTMLPTDTPTSSPTPTIEPTPETACYGVATTGLNVRETPGIEGALLGTVSKDTPLPIIAQQSVDGVTWYQHYGLGASRLGWSSGDYIALEPGCNLPPLVKRGVHLLTGASCGNLDGYGVIKGINGNEDCIKALGAANPATLLIWRNWCRIDYGCGDGPRDWGQGDPVAAADDWWRVEYETWTKLGLLDVIDYFEYRNELNFVGDWEIAFDLRMLQHATAAGVCLAMFSDGYGNPTLIQFAERASVLDAMLDSECQPGRYPVISAHSYSRYDSGPWLFDRWQLQRDYWRGLYGDAYDGIGWVFTEFGVRNTAGEYDGRGTPDCIRARVELGIIDAKFAARPEVIGYTIFGWGNLPPWLDWGRCG